MMKLIIKILAIVSLFLYALCWFTNQPTPTLHYIGIALPWLSLFISIPVSYLCKVNDKKHFAVYGYTYAISTFLYFIVLYVISGSVWHQLPHLAACICFIGYFTIEHQTKEKQQYDLKHHEINNNN